MTVATRPRAKFITTGYPTLVIINITIMAASNHINAKTVTDDNDHDSKYDDDGG